MGWHLWGVVYWLGGACGWFVGAGGGALQDGFNFCFSIVF